LHYGTVDALVLVRIAGAGELGARACRRWPQTDTKVLLDTGRGAAYRLSVTITPSLVSVVDDDESVRESLPDLLREMGFAVQAFSSAEDFLASDCIGRTECLVLDVSMPGMSGPELQLELARRRRRIPIVFITAQRDETVRPRLIARGAVECLFKPFSETALLSALSAALRVA
jgi:FixJ family two-component response regulator